MSHPQGWEPGITWSPSSGGVITAIADDEPDPAIWAQLIEDWGLDPSRTEIVGEVQIRAWDSPDPDGGLRRLKYYRAVIKPKEPGKDRADITALCKLVEKRKPKPLTPTATDHVYFVGLSDWQLGKANEVGGGTPETVERIYGALERSLVQAKSLRKVGKGSETVVLAGLGDIVEGCGDEWYAMGTWSQDLNQREQDRLARRLLLAFIDAYVDAGYKVIAPCVPGNHGENRRGGKAFTDLSDNRDVSCFETVAEIMAANPERYGNVTVPLGAIQDDELTAVLDLGGLPVGLAHGHQFRGSGATQAKVESWWKGQALGRTPIADAELLIAGHGHHLVISEATGRTFIQVPAMDGGSRWWTSTTGQHSPAGMLTMNVGLAVGTRGWSDLAVV